MNTNSFFPSNESMRSLSSNGRLNSLLNGGHESSNVATLKQHYQESLKVNIRQGESQGRQVFSKSIEFSLGVKTESSYEFKIPSPKEVAATVLGFVENRINLEKSSGASSERLENLLSQARSGIEKGYAQAEKDIEALGMMTDELASDISEGFDLINLGLDKIGVEIAGTGTAKPALSEEKNAEILESTSQTGAVSQSNANLFGSSLAENLNSVQASERGNVANLSGSIRQLTENNADFVLNTKEGDQVFIRMSDLESLRYSKNNGNESLQISQSSQFEFSVKGDINESELLAINDLLEKIGTISSLFFSEQFDEAFNSALNLGFDSEQIASFSLDLSSMQVQEVRAYQESSKSALDSYKRNQPLINMAQQFEGLSSLIQPMERFEKVHSMVEALVLKALEHYSPESSNDEAEVKAASTDYVSFARKLLDNAFLMKAE